MVRTIIFFLYFGITLLGTIPALMRAKKMNSDDQLEEKRELVYKIASSWSKRVINLVGPNVEVVGLDNIPRNEAVVFIANHQGNFDIPMLMAYINRPIAFIAKEEIKKMPIIRSWMLEMKCVFMNREDNRQALRAISDGAKIVREGQSMVIFPEGTRSKGNPLGEFKPGSLKLATKAEAPIVPITIDGTYRMMESNGGKVKSADVKITVHPPIITKDMTKEVAATLADRVRDIIISGLNNL